jgi:hypothetical protein
VRDVMPTCQTFTKMRNARPRRRTSQLLRGTSWHVVDVDTDTREAPRRRARQLHGNAASIHVQWLRTTH